MCCFTRPVKFVTNTRIFARDARWKTQFLVYEMQFSAAEDLAMILPLPVPRLSPDDAVRFINLEKYPTFFADMDAGFPATASAGMGSMGAGSFGSGNLKVVAVGSFEASFVPSVDDFERLDQRFRLPTEAWDKLPKYQGYGFAVFKLKKDTVTAHPMAFEFPRADQTRLFFPTVHIHDGHLYPKAGFDHALYAQFGSRFIDDEAEQWKESAQPAGMFVKMANCAGIVDEKTHVYKRVIRGKRKNEDIVI